jgi:hypothetical protein
MMIPARLGCAAPSGQTKAKGKNPEWRGYTLLRNVTALGASKSGP